MPQSSGECSQTNAALGNRHSVVLHREFLLLLFKHQLGNNILICTCFDDVGIYSYEQRKIHFLRQIWWRQKNTQ